MQALSSSGRFQAAVDTNATNPPTDSGVAGGIADVLPARRPNDARFHDPSWFVYVEGGSVVGPVSADQIARGIRAGRVPTDASVQRSGDVFWNGVLDETEVIAALKAL